MKQYKLYTPLTAHEVWHDIGTGPMANMTPENNPHFCWRDKPMLNNPPTGNSSYEIRVNRVVVLPQGKEIFHEEATYVEIVDDAAGEYVKVWNSQDSCVSFDTKEWPALRDAIDYMVKECRE
jgi:hypothetical protein